MKVQILKRSEMELEVLVEGINAAFANGLRRTMISEVPTMCIEDVEVFENSSSLYDEMIAHRLGLIPLKTDLESYVLPEECVCGGEGCSSCSLMFILDREGPGIVYSGDLQSEDPRIFPVSDDIPIVELAEGERVRMECTARLGRGLEHAKWQPGVISYKNLYEVKVPESCDPSVAERCKRGVLAAEDGRVVVVDTTRCNLCRVCQRYCPEIQIDVRPDVFIFKIESNGSLPADVIFLKALDILESKAQELSEKV